MTGFKDPITAVTVTGPVTVGGTVGLNAGSSIDVNNPNSLADAIFHTGVPSILKEDNLVSLPGNLTLAAHSSINIPNIGQYASLIVIMAGVAPQALQINADQNTPFDALDYTYREYLTNLSTINSATWVLPVNAQSYQMTNTTEFPINLVVYGTNRPVSKITQLGESTLPRKFLYNGALTAGVLVTLPSVDQAGSSYTRFNRKAFVRGATSGGAAGLIGYQYSQQDGTIATSYVTILGTGANSFVEITHPIVPVQWVLNPSTTSSGVASLDITSADV